MKRKQIGRIVAVAAIGCMTAVSLSGCMMWNPGWQAGREAGREIGNEVRDSVTGWSDDLESDMDNLSDDLERDFSSWSDDFGKEMSDWTDNFGADMTGWASDVLTDMPDVEELLENGEQPEENRETVDFADPGATKLELEADGANNVVVRPSADASYHFIFDKAHFSVRTETEGGELKIDVDQLKRNTSDPSYRMYIEIPARNYDKVEVDADNSGFSLLRLAAPLEIDGENCGIAMEGCTGSLNMDLADYGLSLSIPKEYVASMNVRMRDGGAAIRFPEGFPENGALQADGSDAVLTGSLGGGRQLGDVLTHEQGNGSVKLNFAVENGAAVFGE